MRPSRILAQGELRLSNTQITDAGFREYLAPSQTLRELDLRDTRVTRKTVAAWSQAVPGRRVLR